MPLVPVKTANPSHATLKILSDGKVIPARIGVAMVAVQLTTANELQVVARQR